MSNRLPLYDLRPMALVVERPERTQARGADDQTGCVLTQLAWRTVFGIPDSVLMAVREESSNEAAAERAVFFLNNIAVNGLRPKGCLDGHCGRSQPGGRWG